MTITTDLELVGTDEEQDGLYHVGVMVDGAFLPLGAYKLGSLEQRKNTPAALAHAKSKEDPDATPETPAA